MTTQQNQTFRALLQSWNIHQDARAGRVPIAELAASRAALDNARLQAARQFTTAAKGGGGVASPELAWPTDLSNFGGRCFVCDLPQALTELLGSA
jgi:hypothetical protein